MLLQVGEVIQPQDRGALLKRIISTIVAIVALALATANVGLAQSNGGGKSGDAPGQAQAGDQCFRAFLHLFEGGVAARGGPKYALETGETPGIAPLNCDHFWQNAGAIGNATT